MRFFKRFHRPVQKIGGSGEIIEVGDPLQLVLRDNSTVVVQASAVQNAGHRVGWDQTGAPVNLVVGSSQNATTAASDDTTGDALANALKASYNLAVIDNNLLFSTFEQFGSPTAATNATTAASNDGTRLALANALRLNMLALAVDLREVQAAFPELTSPVPAIADFSPIGSDDATTQTLLNNLKAKYNLLQTAIAEAFADLDTGGYFQPRSEDVIAVSGNHQIGCPDEDDAEYGNLHDGPEDEGTFDHVVNPAGTPSTPPASLRSTVRAPREPEGKKAKAASEKKAKKQAKKGAKKAKSKKK